MTITTPAGDHPAMPIPQCGTCLGAVGMPATRDAMQWAELAGPCACAPADPGTDPRTAGGRYWDGYWQSAYTVLAMWCGTQRGSAVWLHVQWADGHETQHCTSWDAARDRALA